jgi:hypothetical protein
MDYLFIHRGRILSGDVDVIGISLNRDHDAVWLAVFEGEAYKEKSFDGCDCGSAGNFGICRRVEICSINVE